MTCVNCGRLLTIMKIVLEKIFLALMGLLFIIYGLMVPVLNVAGSKAIGSITDIRREGGERNEMIPNRYSWSVTYEFDVPGGKEYSGNTKVIGSAMSSGVSKGPVTVMYLKPFPYLNAIDESSFFPLERIIILAAGVLFAFLLFRKKKDKANSHH